MDSAIEVDFGDNRLKRALKPPAKKGKSEKDVSESKQ